MCWSANNVSQFESSSQRQSAVPRGSFSLLMLRQLLKKGGRKKKVFQLWTVINDTAVYSSTSSWALLQQCNSLSFSGTSMANESPGQTIPFMLHQALSNNTADIQRQKLHCARRSTTMTFDSLLLQQCNQLWTNSNKTGQPLAWSCRCKQQPSRDHTSQTLLNTHTPETALDAQARLIPLLDRQI